MAADCPKNALNLKIERGNEDQKPLELGKPRPKLDAKQYPASSRNDTHSMG